MSKAFLGFMLALSVFLLWLNLTAAQAKPAVIILWLLIGGFSAYKLCKRPSRAS